MSWKNGHVVATDGSPSIAIAQVDGWADTAGEIFFRAAGCDKHRAVAPHCKVLLGRLCDRASALDFAVMILLPPITREEDVLPAIDLLSRGEAIVVVASFRRPENLSEEIIWQGDEQGDCVPKSSQKQLRCVRRKSESEIQKAI